MFQKIFIFKKIIWEEFCQKVLKKIEKGLSRGEKKKNQV